MWKFGRKPIQHRRKFGIARINTRDFVNWTSTTLEAGPVSYNTRTKKWKIKGPLGFFVQWTKGK